MSEDMKNTLKKSRLLSAVRRASKIFARVLSMSSSSLSPFSDPEVEEKSQ